MVIGKFSRDHPLTAHQQNNFRGQKLIGRNQSNWSCEMYWPNEMISQVLTGHNQQCYFGNS